MMKINYNLLIVGLIAVNLVLAVYLLYIKSTYINPSENKALIVENSSRAEELIIKIMQEENKKINPDILFYDTINRSYSLKGLVEQKGRFFFYIPSSGCHKCLDGILKDMHKYCGETLLQNIVFYTSFQDNTTILELQRKYKISIYSVKDSYIGFLSEREQDHFMFFLDPHLQIHYFYQPDESLKKTNITYYQLCKTVL